MTDLLPSAVARAAGFPAVAATLEKDAAQAEKLNASGTNVRIRRLRHTTKPLSFVWKERKPFDEFAEKKIDASKLPSTEDFKRLMAAETEISARFARDMAPYVETSFLNLLFLLFDSSIIVDHVPHAIVPPLGTPSTRIRSPSKPRAARASPAGGAASRWLGAAPRASKKCGERPRS